MHVLVFPDSSLVPVALVILRCTKFGLQCDVSSASPSLFNTVALFSLQTSAISCFGTVKLSFTLKATHFEKSINYMNIYMLTLVSSFMFPQAHLVHWCTIYYEAESLPQHTGFDSNPSLTPRKACRPVIMQLPQPHLPRLFELDGSGWCLHQLWSNQQSRLSLFERAQTHWGPRPVRPEPKPRINRFGECGVKSVQVD